MILAKDSYGFEKLLARVSQVVQRFSVKHSQKEKPAETIQIAWKKLHEL